MRQREHDYQQHTLNILIRRWLITIALVCLAVLGAVAWQRHEHTVPWDECSEVYRHYAHADGIEATFVHDYRIGDTLTVDVTILHATDSISWGTLKKNFKIYNPSEQGRQSMARGEDNLEIVKHDIENDIYTYDICVASHRDRYIAVFHTSNQSQKDIILDIIINKLFNALITNNNFLNNEKGI